MTTVARKFDRKAAAGPLVAARCIPKPDESSMRSQCAAVQQEIVSAIDWKIL